MGGGVNGQCVAGVCWTMKMVSRWFLGAGGGTTANASLAVDDMTDLKTHTNLKMVATHNSWSGGSFSQGLKEAVERGGAAGVLFGDAAGNSAVNGGNNPQYPVAYNSDAIISLASITSTGALSSFLNYGATSVHIGAPGRDIWSTLPGRFKFQSKYGSDSVTSMATPHISGAAALCMSVDSGATAAQVTAAILNTATPTPSLAGKTVTGGRLNVSGF
jgi:subtilisin family serine protease